MFYWVISLHPATVIDSQRYHEEGNLPATSLWLACWDCYGGTEHLSVLQRSSSQTRRYLWVIFCSSRWTSKESAGLKIYVLAISQDLLKSINKLPLSVNWSYLCCKTPNVDLACRPGLLGYTKKFWILMFSMLLSFINGTTGTWEDINNINSNWTLFEFKVKYLTRSSSICWIYELIN